MTNHHNTAKAPCKSCPYRRDVPSGVWHAHEYEKLPAYDGEIIDQLQAGAVGLFFCHQNDGCLCAGWVGTHGPDNLLALRLWGRRVDPAVWEYQSPVPLFGSGQEAAAHGMRDIEAPNAKAEKVIERLVKKEARRGKR